MATLGVIVPCRNEEPVVARKLANLARCSWPASDRRHVLAIVDDGSDDETREEARLAAARWRDEFERAGVEVRVLENDVRPGKTGAIDQGLRSLAGDVDLIVLTDADVVLDREALVELERVFDGDPSVGMACAAQRMVASLAHDGSLASDDGSPTMPRATFYDVATSWVRRLESLAGAVFSVHGQLMAWRASLDLRPMRGMAADDLDLMLQARCAGARIVFAPRAVFYEARPTDKERRSAQQTRRARAFLQFLSHPRRAEFAAAGPLLWRLQAAAYLHLPAICAAVLIASFAAYIATWAWSLPPAIAWSVRIASVAVSLPLAFAVQRTFGRAGALARTDGRPMRDRWETSRK